MSVSGQLVAVGDVRMHVNVRRGDPRVTALLLINGIGAGLEAFGSFVEALDPDIPAIRVDPPGLGGSPAARRPYRMPALARTLLGVLDVLEQPRVDVLGSSWGGFLAQLLACTGGARCRRLILVATGAGGATVPAPPWVLTKMVTPRRYQDPAYLRRIAPAIYGGSARHDPAVPTLALHSPTGTGPGEGYVHQLAAITGWTSVRFLRTLSQPTLILAGDDDPLVPLINARILGALIPNARVNVHSGGHVELVADPHRLVLAIEDFLASDDAATDVSGPRRRVRWTWAPPHLGCGGGAGRVGRRRPDDRCCLPFLARGHPRGDQCATVVDRTSVDSHGRRRGSPADGPLENKIKCSRRDSALALTPA